MSHDDMYMKSEAEKKHRHVISFIHRHKKDMEGPNKISQTTRRLLNKPPIKVGDTLVMHGWIKKPFQSKWSWRKNVTVVNVVLVTLEQTPDGVLYMTRDGKKVGDRVLNDWAKREGCKNGRHYLEELVHRYERQCRKEFESFGVYQIVQWDSTQFSKYRHIRADRREKCRKKGWKY